MKRIIVLLLVMILAACGSSNDDGDETPALPTRFEVATATVEATEAPVEEASSEPVASNTPLPRPTLPPTWTPEAEATATITQLPPTATAFIPSGDTTSQSEACLNYRVDFDVATREFRLGSSPTIAWTPVEGVGLYRIYVIDEFENQIYFDLVTETTVVIPAETFTYVGLFGWSVEPLDTVGVQMCTARGGEFTATR